MSQSLGIIVSCHNYQRRFNWMCSSIVQQCDDKIPVITMYVAHVRENGNPTCEDTAKFFWLKHGLEFQLLTYEDTSELQFRGLARNKQIKMSNDDWLMFADCDVVYTRSFFVCLNEFMNKHRNEGMMYHCGRFSCDINLSNRIVDMMAYPSCIDQPWTYCANMPFEERRNIGAGYFQLVERKTIKELCNDQYVDPTNCRDESWTHIHKTRSDHQFRKMLQHRKVKTEELMEGVKWIENKKKRLKGKELEITDTPIIFHLSHMRDNMVGHHLEDQR